jgi:lysophospholipase L1-like esterase
MASRIDEVVVAVWGHSYIRRLEDYVAGGDFGICGGQRVIVRYFGRGGATAREGPRSLLNDLPDVLAINPRIVFLHIGENDLGAVSPQELGQLIWRIADQLRRNNVPDIIVGQLLDMPANRRLGQDVRDVNRMLNVVCDSVATWYWRHRGGFWSSRIRNLFSRDGIHLNNVGLRLYMHSVRCAVCSTVRQERHYRQ